MIDELTRKGLLDYIKPRFKLRWEGAHGIRHWRSVFHVIVTGDFSKA